ncbi:MAG: DNA/RNA non-specific endonuclease [Bacteroidales bacterium]|nr:DNA/RNA non-specific endonuclease [Bacteroidales bacterium]
MKLRHFTIAVLAAVSMLVSCSEPENNGSGQQQEAASVAVSPASLSFTSSAESKEVTVTTNCNWTAQSDADWASVSITSGGVSRSGAVVKVTVQANKGEARNATVTFTGKGSNTVTTKLAISQEGYQVPKELTPSATSINVLAKGETKSLSFKATEAWTAAASVPWIAVSPASGDGSEKSQVLTITVGANADEARTGKVTFTMGDLSKEVTVSQQGAPRFETITVSEFISKAPDTGEWYRLTGTITQICDNTAKAFGNFYIKDGTGEVFVYGMTKEYSEGLNDQTFAQLGLKEGDELTFITQRSEYHGEPQAGGNLQPAYYESHIPHATPPREYADYKANSTSEPWLELPATSEGDEHQILHHTMFIGSNEVRNYSMYWDRHHLVARWVAYPLYRKAWGYGTRTDKWGLDPLLKSSEQPVLNNTYSSSDGKSYDRGHQIPSADRLCYESNVKTFYWTNMTPQLNALNGQLWADLEQRVRDWSWPKNYDTDTLYVVTGCVVDDSVTTVKDNEGKSVTVPTHYYKALLRVYQGNYNAIGFWLEHREYTQKKVDQSIAVSIDQLEELTGEDFFHNLPDGVESAVEAKDPTADSWWWNNLKQ